MTEPLPGIVKTGELFITLEHQLGWLHNISGDGAWEVEIIGQIEAWLSERGGALQLIRRPGRISQQLCDSVNVYIAYCEPVDGSEVFLGRRMVIDVEDLMTLDVHLGQPTEGATHLDHPPFLICTHGERDRCCATKDYPPATTMHNPYSEVVWETSHSKGYRFAPAGVLLLQNYSLGRLSVVDVKRVIEDTQQGTVHAEDCRGRGIYTPQGQAVELVVCRQADAWGVDDVVRVGVDGMTAVIAPYDGPSDRDKIVKYEVALEKITTEGVVSSCGDAPGPKKGWVAVKVARRQLATG